MGTLLVHGGELYTPFEAIADGAVFARDGVVEYVGRRADVASGPADIDLDVGGRLICPGFIDLQVNGGGGVVLTSEPNVDAVQRMAVAHARFGTTSMLPTVVTADQQAMLRALEAVGVAVAQPAAGARVLGAHLEGPFINPNRRGAHPEQSIELPRLDLFERLWEASNGSLRLITLAPELPGAGDLIEAALRASMVVSIGHSEASFEQTRAALSDGASMGTHLFNAMPDLGHREPGIVGALLDDDRATVGLIADGVHVHPSVLTLVARAKGSERTALVTDSLASVGTELATFSLLDEEVRVRDGACYLSDGTLAGSTLSMNRAVRTMNALAGVPLIECVQMATSTPARVLGMQDEIGVLKPGARADMLICDGDLNVWKSFIGGELEYDAEAD